MIDALSSGGGEFCAGYGDGEFYGDGHGAGWGNGCGHDDDGQRYGNGISGNVGIGEGYEVPTFIGCPDITNLASALVNVVVRPK